MKANDNLTILVVDDEKSVRDLLAMGLSRARPTTTTLRAEGGVQALNLLAANPVDLVVTDLTMPGMNGLDLLKEIKVKYPDLPVILASGSIDEADIQKAIASGAIAYLEKPFHPKAILEAVEAL